MRGINGSAQEIRKTGVCSVTGQVHPFRDGRSAATQFRKADAKSVATATHIIEAIS
jgi:hypothetical protein